MNGYMPIFCLHSATPSTGQIFAEAFQLEKILSRTVKSSGLRKMCMTESKRKQSTSIPLKSCLVPKKK